MYNDNRQPYDPRRAAAARRAKRARERKIRRTITCTVLAVIILLIAVLVFKACSNKETNVNNEKGAGTSQQSKSNSTKETKPKGDPNKAVATAKILSTGDVLIHQMILDNSKTSSGEYAFEKHFQKVKKTIESADYSVANLEVTLGGKDKGYSCFPCFNIPDSITDALKYAGFNFLVTANNHCYDTSFSGLKRTAEVVKKKGFGQTGTRSDLSQKKYAVVEVNGIKIGIVNYTYETNTDQAGRKALNGILMAAEANEYVNSFHEKKLDKFYSEMEENIKNMKKDGAEAIMLYIHWGVEYQLSQSSTQEKIAQKMCDLGVDVIIGGHPHVIQPATTLTSEVSGKKTFCIYSVGNALSNQRIAYMGSACTTGHTEDGILVYTTFTKYGDGRVELTGVDYTPTWVNRYDSDGKFVYEITPLDNLDSVSKNKSEAQKSRDRTIKIVDEGFKAFNNK